MERRGGSSVGGVTELDVGEDGCDGRGDADRDDEPDSLSVDMSPCVDARDSRAPFVVACADVDVLLVCVSSYMMGIGELDVERGGSVLLLRRAMRCCADVMDRARSRVEGMSAMSASAMMSWEAERGARRRMSSEGRESRRSEK